MCMPQIDIRNAIQFVVFDICCVCKTHTRVVLFVCIPSTSQTAEMKMMSASIVNSSNILMDTDQKEAVEYLLKEAYIRQLNAQDSC